MFRCVELQKQTRPGTGALSTEARCTGILQALVRWGGALLELAHYKQGQESIDMIQQVITFSARRFVPLP